VLSLSSHPAKVRFDSSENGITVACYYFGIKNFKHPVPKTADFGGRAAWTDNRYKLITAAANRKDGEADGRNRLYDLVNDPGEATNIAEDHPEIVAKMMKQLHEWQASVERSLSGADYAKAKDAADDTPTD